MNASPRRTLWRGPVPVRRALAALLVAAAAVALVVRIPAAVRGFDSQARYGAGQKAYGGALAAADGVLIPDAFVVSALEHMPLDARYAVLRAPTLEIAETDYHMAKDTYLALPALMFEVLLPRVPVDAPVAGQFVICYGCDTSPYEGRTNWFYSDEYGRKIGLVEH